jgi:HK97 gp10 family phage protein
VVFTQGWERELDSAQTSMLRRLGVDILGDMQAMAPVDTGRLRDSLHADVDGDTLRIASDADYAAYVELGTRDHAPQPFMRPALYRRRSL